MAGILSKISARLTFLSILLLLVLACPTRLSAKPAGQQEEVQEMYSPSDTLSADDFGTGLFDDMSSGCSGMDESFISQAMDSFLHSYDDVLVTIFKHYFKYIIAFAILFYIIEVLLLWILINMARKYRRNIVIWCFMGIFAGPVLAIVLLLLSGRRKDFESSAIS